jgi:hypothetical protein
MVMLYLKILAKTGGNPAMIIDVSLGMSRRFEDGGSNDVLISNRGGAEG